MKKKTIIVTSITIVIVLAIAFIAWVYIARIMSGESWPAETKEKISEETITLAVPQSGALVRYELKNNIAVDMTQADYLPVLQEFKKTAPAVQTDDIEKIENMIQGSNGVTIVPYDSTELYYELNVLLEMVVEQKKFYVFDKNSDSYVTTIIHQEWETQSDVTIPYEIYMLEDGRAFLHTFF